MTLRRVGVLIAALPSESFTQQVIAAAYERAQQERRVQSLEGKAAEFSQKPDA